jgi:hypothetical protein
MKRILTFMFMAAIAGAFLVSCSNDPAGTELTQPDLEDFGDFQATAEAPAFGDPLIADLSDGDEPYDDIMAQSTEVTDVESSDNPQIYGLRMIWGNLLEDEDVTDLTDWSGSLTISRGAVVVFRVMSFEDGQDYIVERSDPALLEWVSQTSCCRDGLFVKFFIPELSADNPEQLPPDEDFTVTYESPQLTISFTLDQIAGLDTLVTVGPGNAISFRGTKFERIACPHGYLEGRWTRDDNGDGIFYGRWLSRNGLLKGHLRGTWGTDDSGRRVFVGKWIDASGAFEGFLRGTWSNRMGINSAVGFFRGFVYDAECNKIGELGGHYRRGDVSTGGFFAGLWRIYCQRPEIDADEG